MIEAFLPQAEAEPDTDALLARRPWLRAHARVGVTLDGAPLAAIADRFGTPAFVYGAATLGARATRLRVAMDGIALHYAMKANGHLALLSRLGRAGYGVDVVSGGELARAGAAGIAPSRCVFSGVGKTAPEIARALDAGVGQINVESPEELSMVAAIAEARGVRAPVALRVNPDVAAGGHDRISTGRAADKFGIALDHVAPACVALFASPWLQPMGLAVHVGSNIDRAAPFTAAYARLASLVRALRADGLKVEAVDCGGGLGVAYDDAPAMRVEAWAGAIRTAFDGLELRLSAEPGRWLVAPAGVLLARVVRVRRADRQRPVIVLDAAMNDLLRPTLYEAWHGIVPVSAARLAAPREPADVVGPVCESGDRFARARVLPRLEPGDVVALLDAGAYGAVMRSTYNARPAAPEILVREDGEPVEITPRGTIDGLWTGERLA